MYILLFSFLLGMTTGIFLFMLIISIQIKRGRLIFETIKLSPDQGRLSNADDNGIESPQGTESNCKQE